MAEKTGIAWTEKTYNPWHGCTKVSPGCAHCYMFREKKQYGQDPELVVKSKTKFKDPLKWKEPALVFTCSWSDFFHEAADAWRAEVWAIMKATPHLTYQVLTKRIERAWDALPADWGEGYPNVWLGVSVENQRFAHRVDLLTEIPAARRFVSAEPLLGPLDLTSVRSLARGGNVNPLSHIDWVIVGGESGPDCRPMSPAWARVIRNSCAAHGVYFFLKQLGGNPDARAHDKAVLDGETYTAIPPRT